MRIKSMLQFASMILLALWVSSASAAADGSDAGTLTPREIIAQAQAAAAGKPIFIWAMDGHPLGCT